MVKYRAKTVAVVAGAISIVVLMAWLSPNDSKEDNADRPSKPESSARYDSQDQTASNSRRRPERKRQELRKQHVATKPDRSSPEKAFDQFVGCLRHRDFKGCYDSFTEDGRKEISEGRILTKDEIESMAESFKRAGFKSLEITSKTFTYDGDVVEVTADIVSIRNGKSRKERLVVSLELVLGEWRASKFTVTPSAD